MICPVTLLIAALLQDELFRDFEKKWNDAPKFTLTFRGEAHERDEKATYSGSLRIEGAEYLLKVGHNLDRRDRVEELATDKRVPARYHRLALTRAGFLLGSRAIQPLLKGAAAADDPFPVSDVKVVRENKETILSYTLKADGAEWKVRLWIDETTMTPLRRTLSGEDLDILETYTDFKD